MTAFPGKVASVDSGRIRLDNGALVEVSVGAAVQVSAGMFTKLLLRDDTCRLWVEGRRTYPCDVREAPARRGDEGVETSLLEVSENGKTLRLFDGSIYSPLRLGWIDASVWMSQARVVVIGDTIINLDRAGARPLRVRRGY